MTSMPACSSRIARVPVSSTMLLPDAWSMGSGEEVRATLTHEAGTTRTADGRVINGSLG